MYEGWQLPPIAADKLTDAQKKAAAEFKDERKKVVERPVQILDPILETAESPALSNDR